MKHTIAELIAILAMDTSKFKQGIKSAETATSKMAQNLQKLGKQGMKYVTLPLVAVGTASVKMAMDFESSITALYTIMDEATYKSRDWGQEVIDLSRKMGESTDVLADGLYFLVGSGIDAAKAMGVLEIAAKSAKAGFTDTATAVKALASVLNAYQMDADDAEKVSDILFATVNYGVITYEELAHSIGRVLPVAAAANISLEELGAALTVLTLGGLESSMAVTALMGTILSFLKPTPQAIEIADELGFTMSATALATDGLHGTLKKLAEALNLTDESIEDLNDSTLTEAELQKMLAERAGVTVEKIASMFTNVRALVGVLSLLKGGGVEFDKQMKNMTNTAGTLETAFSKVTETSKFQFDLALSSLKATSIEIGTKLLPLVTKLFKGVGNLAGKFGDLSDAGQTAVIAIGGIAATIPVLMYVTGSIMSLIIKFKTLGIVITAAKVAALGMYTVIGAAAIGAGKYMSWSYKKAIEMNEKYGSIQRSTQLGIHEIGETVERTEYEMSEARKESTRTMEENLETIMDWCHFAPSYLSVLDDLKEAYENGDITIREYEEAIQFLIYTQGMYVGSAEEVIKNVDKSERGLNLITQTARDLDRALKDGKGGLDETAEGISGIEEEADEAGQALDELRSSFDKLINAMFEHITTFTEFKLSQFEVIAAEKELEEAEKELEKAQKATGAAFTANDEALHAYLSTNIEYLENQQKQGSLQEKLNKLQNEGKTGSLEYLKAQEAFNTVQAEGNKIIDEAARKTGTYISTGVQTEAQLKRVIEKEEEYYEALQALDRANIQLIKDSFELSTSIKATTEQQEEAKESAIKLGLQYVELGKIGISEFMQVAEQFGLSKDDIIKYAEEMDIEVQKYFDSLKDASEIDFQEIEDYFEATGRGIKTIARDTQEQASGEFAEMENKFGETKEGIVSKAQIMGLEIDRATKLRDIKITADTSQASRSIQGLLKELGTIKDKAITITTRQRLEKFMGKEGALFSAQSGKYFRSGSEIPVIVHPPEVLLNPKQALNVIWNLANIPASKSESTRRAGDIKNIFNIATLVVREEADTEKIGEFLYERQISSQRGGGNK